MESPSRESGQVRSRSGACSSLLLGVLVRKRRACSAQGGFEGRQPFALPVSSPTRWLPHFGDLVF